MGVVSFRVQNKCKKMLCLRSEPYTSSVFKVHKNEDYTIMFETAYGTYMSRCLNCIYDCDNAVCADTSAKFPNAFMPRGCKFHIIKNQDGTIRLQSDNGRFVQRSTCAQSCGAGKILTASGLTGNDLDFVVERTVVVPKPKPFLQFHPKWHDESVPNGVSLSNVV